MVVDIEECVLVVRSEVVRRVRGGMVRIEAVRPPSQRSVQTQEHRILVVVVLLVEILVLVLLGRGIVVVCPARSSEGQTGQTTPIVIARMPLLWLVSMVVLLLLLERVARDSIVEGL